MPPRGRETYLKGNVGTVFLDIARAYDTPYANVSHHILRGLLYERFEISSLVHVLSLHMCPDRRVDASVLVGLE